MDTSVVILSGWKEDIEELNSVLIFLKKNPAYDRRPDIDIKHPFADID